MELQMLEIWWLKTTIFSFNLNKNNVQYLKKLIRHENDAMVARQE